MHVDGSWRMAGFGVGMANRELECILCGSRFTAMAGDLLIPETCICDACIAALRGLDGAEIARYVSQHLRDRDRALQDRIVQHIHTVVPRDS
jgi:hypothetical protein